jgi:hypothetical protein
MAEQRGWSTEEIAPHLNQMSSKAKTDGDPYAHRTAARGCRCPRASGQPKGLSKHTFRERDLQSRDMLTYSGPTRQILCHVSWHVKQMLESMLISLSMAMLMAM